MPRPLSPDEIQRVLTVTDDAGLHREHVRVPLGAIGDGAIEVQGDTLQITVPENVAFDDFIAGLPERLGATDLSAIPRAED